MTQYFGKYRGKVENNIDPQQMGRIQVSVPAILGGGKLSWAMPCVPYAGKDVGLYAIPPRHANVWVEFEGGDPDYPIWSGCFWGMGELPAQAHTPGTNLFKTGEVTVKIIDLPGAASFSVETKTGMRIEMGPEGVTIDNGHESTVTISLDGIEIKQSQGGAIQVDPQEIQIDNGQGSTVKLSPQGIQIDTGSNGSIKLGPPGIQIDNGKGGTVELEGPKVAINKEALEVT